MDELSQILQQLKSNDSLALDTLEHLKEIVTSLYGRTQELEIRVSALEEKQRIEEPFHVNRNRFDL